MTAKIFRQIGCWVGKYTIFRFAFLSITILMLQACTHLLFAPMQQHVLTPDQIDLVYSDITVTGKDGVRLHGWYLPAQGPVKGAIVFLHGNGENISTHLATVYWLPAQGYEIFMFDYRGYGMSEGRPDLQGSALDVETALEYAINNRSTDRKPVVLGHSFGGSIGIYAVAKSRFRDDLAALVTIGAFSDYRAVTRDVLARSWLTWPFQWPLSLTINNDFSPVKYVADISPLPLLIMHSETDEIVPYYHAGILFEHARQPKSFETIQGDHNHVFRQQANRQFLLDYLQSLP